MRSFTLLSFFIFLATSLSAQIFVMDGSPINSCDGFFMDSGGGSADYGANENLTTTICPDGTTGTHIKLNFSAVNIADGDLLCFYDGVDITAPQLSCHTDFLPNTPFIIQATAANPSGCVTITFTSDGAGQAAGWSADMSCIPSCQTIIATLTSTDPVVMPADTGYIDICPGDRVFFNAAGEYPQDGVIYNHSDATSGFFWDFGDGNTAVGPNTSHIYDEPGGYIVELTIIDQLGCTNTNFISQRIRVSTYPNFELGGDIPDEICAGDTISLNAFVTNIDSTFEVSVTPTEGGFPTGGVRSDSLPLPDGTGATYSTTIVFNNFAPGQVLTDINDLLSICVNMEHSWMHDLQIDLICPDGTTVVLQQQVFEGLCLLGIPNETDEGMDPPLQGVGWDYCWTPTATNGTWTEYWQAFDPPTLPEGDYNAFGNLEDFLGCPLNGEWTIVVQDLWGIDNGWIFEWSIDFAPELYPNVETFTPQIVDWQWDQNSSIVFYSNDSITAALNNAGNPSYTFTVTDDFGCSSDTTVVVDVLPPTHPNCFECETIDIALADTTICTGDAVSFDASPDDPLEELAVTFEAFSNEEFDGDTHPPGNPLASTLFVSYINPAVLTNPFAQIESVCVNLEHNFDADVELRLQAPNGVIIELSTDNGGGGDDYIDACFTPTATTPITAGAAPFTGDWQPEGDWADLTGSDITGDWVLLVADDVNGFGGTFIDWSITFNNENEVSYIWTPAASLSCFNCPDPVATPSTTTEYIVTATDAFGCMEMDTVTITVEEAFPAPDAVCGLQANGELTVEWLAVSGATDYEVSLDGGLTWIPANGLLSHTISGLLNGDVINILVRVVAPANSDCPAGIADLECTYSEACALMVDTFSTVSPSCWNTTDGSIIVLSTGANNPVTYVLDGGLGQTNTDFINVSGGMHTVVATDALGCIDSITFMIQTPDSIEINLVTDSVNCFNDCDGQSVATATGGTGAIDYVWNTVPATNSPTVTGLCEGSYAVVATDINGCTSEVSTAVGQPEALTVVSIQATNISCFDAADGIISVNLTGGTAPYAYLWDDPLGQTDATAVGLEPGSYTLTITDDNGCTTTANAGVTQPASAVTASIAQTFIGCDNASQSIFEVTAMGGDETFTYLWSNGSVVSTAIDLDSIVYAVTVTDGNGCTAVASLQVSELEAITINLLGTDPLCNGGLDGEVTVASVSGGASGYTYLWNTTPPQSGTMISGLAGGTEYILTVTDAQGCTGTASYNLGEPTAIQLSTDSEEPTCNGFEDGSATVVTVIGGTPNYSYLWDASAGGQTTQTASGLNSGNYEVLVTDANGCTAITQVVVEQPTTMLLTFETQSNDCPGDSEGVLDVNVLGGSPNYTYEWENGETTSTIDSLWSGTYEVTVTDANGCFVIDSAAVAGPAPIQVSVDTDQVSCFGEDDGIIYIDLEGGSPPYMYMLDTLEPTGSSILIGLQAGTYDISVVDVNGCTWSSEATVGSPPEFVVNAGDDVSILLGDSIQLAPSISGNQGWVDYTWIPPYVGSMWCFDQDTLVECDGPWAGPFSTTMYQIYAEDANGCSDTDFVTVTVEKERAVYVATGFTPNDDNTNDILKVHGPDNTILRLFRVYDRWGNQVYEYDYTSLDALQVMVNDDFGWDGYFRGEPMNPGVYVWYVEVEYLDGFTKIFQGNTTLIK